VVEHGELFLECLDSFEDIFQIKKDLIDNVELTQILDPYLFDNHRDIVNALFEVYFEIGERYVNKFYDKDAGSLIK